MPHAARAAKNSLCAANGSPRDFAAAMGDDLQAALGHDPRVELLERAGRGIPRIRKWFFARFDNSVIYPLKLGQRHIDFAANFDNCRNRILLAAAQASAECRESCERFALHRRRCRPVAARGGENKLTMLITQIDRHAVNFRISDVTAGDRKTRAIGLPPMPLRRLARNSRRRSSAFVPPLRAASNSSVDRDQFRIDRFKRRPAHLRRSAASYVLSIENIGRAWATVTKALDRLAANPLRGAIGRNELRMSRLEIL